MSHKASKPPQNDRKDFDPTGFTLRDEANALVAAAFRNGPLEDHHSGEPSELLNNPNLSRLTDAEMKEIMLNACEILADYLRMRDESPAEYDSQIKEMNRMYCREWKR